MSYQWAIYQKYDQCGHESPSGYGALGTAFYKRVSLQFVLIEWEIEVFFESEC